MTSPILSSLPAIHATLVGIGGSIITAYAFYAHNELEKLKEEAKAHANSLRVFLNPELLTPRPFEGFLKEGRFDWQNEGKKIFNQASATRHNEASLDEDLLTNFMIVLYLLFISYPIGTKLDKLTPDAARNVSDMEKSGFSLERIEEIQRLLLYLKWTWDFQKENIQALVKYTAGVNRKKEEKKQREAFQRNTKNIPSGHLHLAKEAWWTQRHLPRIDAAVETTLQCDSEIRSCFESIQLALLTIPNLVSAINKYEAAKRIMPLWENIRTTLFWSSMILLIGVLLPMIILDVQEVYYWKWYKVVEYLILSTTVLPYLWAIIWLFRKINAASIDPPL
jgi:hypothetical protein